MSAPVTTFVPEGWSQPPPGFHYEAVQESASWELIQERFRGRRCRAPRCTNDAIVTVYRTTHYRRGPVDMPWHYCADHMYGRWIEDGKVFSWRLVKDEA
ncbi:MAG: hypothetical protein ACJ768_12860 [Gaiellaceae bacterium]